MKKHFSYLFVLAILVMVGCYPEGPDYVEELDIVYTHYDTGTDFTSKGTYSLPDKIVKITGDLGAPPVYIKDIYGVPILQSIDDNMQALGYTKVDVNDNPDLQLLPASWESTTIITGGYYGGYWCWYYPYYCGGGWYYPYQPVASFSTGTLVMTLVNPSAESTDDSKRVVWTGAINGLLTDTYNATRVTKAINQAFTQSPYLKTN